MVATITVSALCMKDDVVLFKLTKMLCFIEAGCGMIWQTGKIHGNRQAGFVVYKLLHSSDFYRRLKFEHLSTVPSHRLIVFYAL